jgi:hypothetical protein
MRYLRFVGVVLMVLSTVGPSSLCIGCAKKDVVYRSVYEGLTQNPIPRREMRDPTYRPTMTYDQYKSYRESVTNPEKNDLKRDEWENRL